MSEHVHDYQPTENAGEVACWCGATRRWQNGKPVSVERGAYPDAGGASAMTYVPADLTKRPAPDPGNNGHLS